MADFKMDMDATKDATKGATMGYSVSYVPSAAIKSEDAAMDYGKDPMDYGKGAMGVAADQAFCKQTPCLPFQYNADGSTTSCDNYNASMCFTEVGYEEFYDDINFGTLKANADTYFEGFGHYCWDWFAANPGAMALFRSVYQSYTYTRSIGKYGMFFEINNLVKENEAPCGDINYSFAIPIGNAGKTLPQRIFHIALHCPKPKRVELVDKSRRDRSPPNCAYFQRPLNPDGTPADTGAGSGPFHYKIDALCSIKPGKAASTTICNNLTLSEDKRPFKEFYYDGATELFVSNDYLFKNITDAEDAIKNPTCKMCTISGAEGGAPPEPLENILRLHNIIYGLFVEYFNTVILPRIRRGGAGLGAMDHSDGGKSIRRKSRRNRKSRKTKKSRKPRRLRKTTRLRK
jgi:hypothetical protein